MRLCEYPSSQGRATSQIVTINEEPVTGVSPFSRTSDTLTMSCPQRKGTPPPVGNIADPGSSPSNAPNLACHAERSEASGRRTRTRHCRERNLPFNAQRPYSRPDQSCVLRVKCVGVIPCSPPEIGKMSRGFHVTCQSARPRGRL